MNRGTVKFGVVVFPGSNCDHDAYYACKKILHQDAVFLWHKEADLKDVDVVILPGGFSYGDYLRCGAIARVSPVMKEVVRFAERGGVVMGICNGFQILVEAGLLPGVLLRNMSLRFICKDVYLRVENANTIFTSLCSPGEVLRVPIAHGDGNYFASDETLQRLNDQGQILFRYADSSGKVTEATTPNGSRWAIAGIRNEAGNVLGMMPHPERAVDPQLGNIDGRRILESVIQNVAASTGGMPREQHQPLHIDDSLSPLSSATSGRR